MIKRIINFTKQDWKHINWLIKGMGKGFIHGDIDEIIDCFYFIKLHLSYDSKKVD